VADRALPDEDDLRVLFKTKNFDTTEDNDPNYAPLPRE
jgi:hypothetical protein